MKRFTTYIFQLAFLLMILSYLQSCKEEVNGQGNPQEQQANLIFEMATVVGTVSNNKITEASGIVNSLQNPEYMWVHNDGGGEPENRLFLMDTTGADKGVVKLEGIDNIDWEDIAIGPGPENNKTYLYIGQIGDNSSQYDFRNIYRIEEPNIVDGNPANNTISQIETITYRYPDGPRDAETILVDPLTKDLYIISKREPKVNIYVARYPQSLTDTITLEQVGNLDFSQATAGDISKDGSEILIKNYTNVFYWKREANESIEETLAKKPTDIPYQIEPQGEAITFAADGSGFFTLSEEARTIEALLYFYKRIP